MPALPERTDILHPRIGSIHFFLPTRADFDHSVTESELAELAGHSEVKVLQCHKPVAVADSAWILLNESFFSKRPDVQLRIYGGDSCDLRVVRHMSNVRRFAADCLMRAQNVDSIAEIPNLESLSLGVFELRDFDVLERISPTLTELFLGGTRSSAPSLAPLARFRSLKTLYLEGQSNDIEVLADLPALEDVTLRSITTPDVNYLAPLKNLWSLDIKLGGIRSFAGIEGKESIKYLELWQIRELRNVAVVSALPGLQNLFLQSLPHIRSFPSIATATALRRVVLQNLKGLHDFSAFERAPALEEFGFIQGNRQTPEQLLALLRNPAVRRVSTHFGSDRKNGLFSRLRDEYGKAEWQEWERFEYR